MWIAFPLTVFSLAVGVWTAWRRPSRFFSRINLRAAVSVVVMTATIAGSLLWVFRGRSVDSPSARLALISASVMLMLASFITVTSQVTDGRANGLPKGARVCDTHRRRIFPWIRRAGALLLLILFSGVLAPPDWVALPLSMGAMVLLVAISILYPLYLKARRFDRGMSALVANPWVRWQYTPEQWQSWAAIQRSWDRAKTPVFRWKRDWAKLLVPILIMGAATGLLSHDRPVARIAIFAGCSAFLLIAAALITWAARCEPERRYRRMLTARREAYLGADGLYCSGEFSPWVLSGNCLVEAAAIHDPPVRLVLTFDKPAGNSTTRIARLIPIPEGCKHDLGVLEDQLRVSCPEASIRLTAPATPRV